MAAKEILGLILLVLRVNEIQSRSNVDGYVKLQVPMKDVAYDKAVFGKQELVDIERRLRVLESDNSRLLLENQKIQMTNMELKRDVRKVRTKHHEIQKQFRRLAIENYNCMQVIGDMKSRVQLLWEEKQKTDTKWTQKVNNQESKDFQTRSRNVTKLKKTGNTAKEETSDFTNSSVGVPIYLGSVMGQSEEILPVIHDELSKFPEEFNTKMQPDVVTE
ncbi:uncharacterized protein LOC117341464 [Pecten maximus]|uniref:uncharacterized protein LOC117341464 n=1 Tax=Pecten maximus TaxID=6579 RepID=UPI001458B0F3|nr:uncharacterized protein LOC117341464 [Pecten maximus]